MGVLEALGAGPDTSQSTLASPYSEILYFFSRSLVCLQRFVLNTQIEPPWGGFKFC